MRPILQEVMKRGLLYIDDGSSTRSMAEASAKAVPFPSLDRCGHRHDRDQRRHPGPARPAGSLARANGVAVGVATALPISLRNISEWLKQLDSPWSRRGAGERRRPHRLSPIPPPSPSPPVAPLDVVLDDRLELVGDVGAAWRHRFLPVDEDRRGRGLARPRQRDADIGMLRIRPGR